MNVALIFAGGVGSRMNSKASPKQFLEIHGKPIIIYTLEHFENHPEIDKICVVCLREWLEHMDRLIKKFQITKAEWVIPGGSTALESQYNGLSAIATASTSNDNDIVLIHDGVRPLIDAATISKCLASVRCNGSAITVAPAIETIVRQTDDNEIVSTIARNECMLARAPQCFYLNDILSVHEKARKDECCTYIDSTSLMLAYGHKVHTVMGPAENIKVTTPSDFYICRALLDAREESQIFGL